LALLAVAAYTTDAFAADPPAGVQPPPSKEVREKMATLHEQMAACLRSDKPLAACRAEMMKNCHNTIGTQGCPMMDMTEMGNGKMGMHGGTMQASSASSSAKP
jgi:hypothetical protein